MQFFRLHQKFTLQLKFNGCKNVIGWKANFNLFSSTILLWKESIKYCDSKLSLRSMKFNVAICRSCETWNVWDYKSFTIDINRFYYFRQYNRNMYDAPASFCDRDFGNIICQREKLIFATKAECEFCANIYRNLGRERKRFATVMSMSIKIISFENALLLIPSC